MYSRLIMADFSFTFNMIQPNLFIKMLLELKVNSSLIKWFLSMLTNRTQQVKINTNCQHSHPQKSIIANGSPDIYFTEVNNFMDWFEEHHLVLNTDKTK